MLFYKSIYTKAGPAWASPKIKIKFFLKIAKRDHKLARASYFIKILTELLTHSVWNLKKTTKWRPGRRLKNEENTVPYSYWLILKMMQFWANQQQVEKPLSPVFHSGRGNSSTHCQRLAIRNELKYWKANSRPREIIFNRFKLLVVWY